MNPTLLPTPGTRWPRKERPKPIHTSKLRGSSEPRDSSESPSRPHSIRVTIAPDLAGRPRLHKEGRRRLEGHSFTLRWPCRSHANALSARPAEMPLNATTKLSKSRESHPVRCGTAPFVRWTRDKLSATFAVSVSPVHRTPQQVGRCKANPEYSGRHPGCQRANENILPGFFRPLTAPQKRGS
jgi:hypothetical protein